MPAGIVVLVLGFVMIGYQHFSPPQPQGQYAAMMGQQRYFQHAKKICIQAAQQMSGIQLYLPSRIDSDGERYADIAWQPEFANPHAVRCRYETRQGLTLLEVDGRSMDTAIFDMSGDNLHRQTDPHAGKHWGHW